jgi:hypothetical protein
MRHFLVFGVAYCPIEQANINISIGVIAHILIFEVGNTGEESQVENLIHDQNVFADVDSRDFAAAA